MSLDDRVLAAQRALDRLVRRWRRGAAPEVTQRRFLVVQIDGLSRAVLKRALASGHMPFLKRLLRRHSHRLEPMAVGLPTSTPAFQLAAMYGVYPDIPGFHYYSRERKGDVHFPRAGHAAWVEAKYAAGRRGILQGGSAYGCIFTGGADNNLFTLASLTRPSGRGLLAAFSPFVVLIWVCLKSLVRTVAELAGALPRFLRRPRDRRQGWRWFTLKIALSIWVRGFFTMAASRDLYAGVPAVYVNYFDYDEASHIFGPRSREARASLRRIDRALHQLARVLRRVPEYQYDLYVLADHGHAPCKAYAQLSGGRRFEESIFEHLPQRQVPSAPAEVHPRSGLVRGLSANAQGAHGVFQRFLNYLYEDNLQRGDPEAHERDGIRVISAGPNAFLYVLDASGPLHADALEQRLPGVAAALSRSPGVGFVLARSPAGPVCFWRGERHVLRASGPGPFAHRSDAVLVVQCIADLMRMPSAGDYVIYGIDAAEGNVSFLPEWGTHAGPSRDEMQTFIVHPAGIPVPLPIVHPAQLYQHFIRYQDGVLPTEDWHRFSARSEGAMSERAPRFMDFPHGRMPPAGRTMRARAFSLFRLREGARCPSSTR